MAEDFNLYPLHVFRLVAKCGSASLAARELHISQPAVSAHLRAVEQKIGDALFERTPRGMLLTAMGETVLDHANRLFSLYDEMPSLADSCRGIIRGEVLIAASSTPGAYFLPRLLQRFQKKYPEAHPMLMVGDSGDVLTWLSEYRVPLGVIGDMASDNALERLEVGADELRMVTASSTPLHRARQITTRQLSEYTLFLREPGSSTRANAEALLGEMLPHFRRVVTLGSAEAIKQAVIANLGVAVLSSWATRLEEKAGLLRPVRDRRFRRARKFHLARRHDRVLNGTALALWDFLRAEGR